MRRPDSTMAGVLWADTVKEAPVRAQPPEAGAEYDLAVVGGGFCGLSVALHAAKSGLSVGLYEAGVIGNGASGRNGGFVVPHFPGGVTLREVAGLIGEKKAQRLCALVADGPQFVFDQVRQYQIECDDEQNGWVQPAHSEKSLRRVRAVYEDWQAFGADVEWLDTEQVSAQLGSPGFLGGWKNGAGGTLNPFALCRGLARAAVNHGASIHEHTPIDRITRDGDRVSVRFGESTSTARKVLIATNGHTGSVWDGLQRSVIPIRLFHVFTKPLAPDQQEKVLPGRLCFTDLHKSGGFCRYDPAGRILSGGAVFALGDPRQAGIRHAKQRLGLFFPHLPEPEIEYYWEGYCALTPPYLPALQIVDKNVYAIIGFSTRGVSLAQNIGRVAANFLAEELALDDFPLPVTELERIPWQGLKAFLGGYAIPYFKAVDRWGLS